MEDFQGKTCFVTGGASGIGFGMASAFGAAGMNVMLADIEREPLEAAVDKLRERQIRAEGVVCDVSDLAAVKAAADKTIETFGKVHVVCNNAGIGSGGPIGQIPMADWDWTIAVNLMGVVYGVEAFLPLIRAHGEGGHFVNTASMAGMVSGPGMEPYNATKFAVVTMSESWGVQLAPENIGVSVLCPGFVNTNIYKSRRTRQDKFGGPPPQDAPPAEAGMIAEGLDPMQVGLLVLDAVKENDPYIFSAPDMRPLFEARVGRILQSFEASARRAEARGFDVRSPKALRERIATV